MMKTLILISLMLPVVLPFSTLHHDAANTANLYYNMGYAAGTDTLNGAVLSH